MSERKLDWRATWKHNGTAMMFFGLFVRPIIAVPLILIVVLGELAGNFGLRIPGIDPVRVRDDM